MPVPSVLSEDKKQKSVDVAIVVGVTVAGILLLLLLIFGLATTIVCVM